MLSRVISATGPGVGKDGVDKTQRELFVLFAAEQVAKVEVVRRADHAWIVAAGKLWGKAAGGENAQVRRFALRELGQCGL